MRTILGAAILLGGLAALALRGRPAPGPEPPAPPATEPTPGGSPAGPSPAAPAPDADPPSALIGRLPEPGAAADAAPALRRAIRTDPAARAQAVAALLDPATPPAIRGALALILGTVDAPDTDPVLLRALGLYGADAEFARAALLALGATRDPEDDDEVFELGDRPWGEEGPCGLGITVNRDIEAESTRSALAGRLAEGPDAARRAAGAALRHSIGHADVLGAFLDRLPVESSDPVAEVVGEALAGYSRTSEEGERNRILDRLLAEAGRPELEGMRFRLENDLSGVPLTDAQRSVLLDLAKPAREFGVRSFAMTVLAGSAAVSGAGGTKDASRAVLDALADPDEAVRDLAARLGGKLPWGAEAGDALGRLAREDPAWNVRYAALETIAATAPEETAREALTRAGADPDERVAGRAAELLERLRGRGR